MKNKTSEMKINKRHERKYDATHDSCKVHAFLKRKFLRKAFLRKKDDSFVGIISNFIEFLRNLTSFRRFKIDNENSKNVSKQASFLSIQRIFLGSNNKNCYQQLLFLFGGLHIMAWKIFCVFKRHNIYK